MAIHSNILAWRIPWTEEPGSYSPWGRKESDTTKRLHLTLPPKGFREDERARRRMNGSCDSFDSVSQYSVYF